MVWRGTRGRRTNWGSLYSLELVTAPLRLGFCLCKMGVLMAPVSRSCEDRPGRQLELSPVPGTAQVITPMPTQKLLLSQCLHPTSKMCPGCLSHVDRKNQGLNLGPLQTTALRHLRGRSGKAPVPKQRLNPSEMIPLTSARAQSCGPAGREGACYKGLGGQGFRESGSC